MSIIKDEVFCTIRVPKEIMDKVDGYRSPTRTPRTSWVLQAIIEKLKRMQEEDLKESR